MANDVVVSDFQDARDGYAVETCTLRGTARSAVFQPSGSSLWQVKGVLKPESELVWSVDHGDEGLFILEGALETTGGRCVTGGAVIVEAGAPLSLRALVRTTVVHVGSRAPGPNAHSASPNGIIDSRSVHLFTTADDAVRLSASVATEQTILTFFGDGSCPGCRIMLFIVDGRAKSKGEVAGSHVHSNDEIIFVIDGELQVGRYRVGPGMSIAVPALRRYGFRTDAGYRYLNYRAAPTMFTGAPGSEPRPETAEAFERAGMFRPIGRTADHEVDTA